MIVQVYEIQTPREAEDVIRLGVDHVGTVLLSKEHAQGQEIKRTVSTVRRMGAKSSIIPLFSDPDSILEVLSDLEPDIVHFCENLLPLGEDGIKKLLNLQGLVKRNFPEILVMRSIPVPDVMCKGAEEIPFRFLKTFEPATDIFLTDTLLIDADGGTAVKQPVEGFLGITGKTCDWALCRIVIRESRIPVILAGGLGPENVYDAIIETGPWGVDSCSGTNRLDESGKSTRFRKDLGRVEAFVRAAKMAGKAVDHAP